MRIIPVDHLVRRDYGDRVTWDGFFVRTVIPVVDLSGTVAGLWRAGRNEVGVS
jgi:hypothetical protein